MESGWGGLMQGIAGGISAGSRAYFEGQSKQREEQQEQMKQKAIQAEQIGRQAYKVATDRNVPLKIRKNAWATWRRVNKEQGTGILAPEIAEEMWNDNDLNAFLKRGQGIIDSKNYDLQTQISMMRELETEAQMALGTDPGKSFDPMKKELETRAFAKGISGLRPTGTTPESTGLLARSERGRGVLAARVKPESKPKQPTIPMYVDRKTKDGKVQRMQWNPREKQHNIPYGDPIDKAAPDTYRTLGGDIYKLEGKKSILIQKGSIEAKAIYTAMQDPQWRYLNPLKQRALVKHHMSFYSGAFMDDEKKASSKKTMDDNKVQPRQGNETIAEYLERVGL